MQDWRDKLGAAFGIEVPATQECGQEPEEALGDALAQQGRARVNILLDKKGRHGKQATLVTDLLADDEAVKDLARSLRQHCGTGGSARGGEILLQGDFRDKVLKWLQQQGFKARII